MKFIHLTLLLYYTWLTSVEVAGDDRPKSCCLKVSKTSVPFENLLDYDIQKSPPCNIRAIRFYTIKDKTLCWDPDEIWAKRAKQAIDARKTTTPPLGPTMCTTRTSTRIPTTPIKTPGLETKTSSRTVTSISTNPSTATKLKTTGLETKTSSRTVTSISTASSTATTFKTTGLQKKIRTTSTKSATVSTETSQSPQSFTKQCTEPNHSTETSHKTPGKDTEAPRTTFTSTTKDRTTTRKKKMPKIIQRKRGKSKKQLWKYHMKMGSQG